MYGPNARTATSEVNPSSLEGYLSKVGRIASDADLVYTALFADFDDDSRKLMNSLPKGVSQVLVRNEPRVVRPQNHRPSLLSRMDLIVDVGRPPASGVLRVNWPQTWDITRVGGLLDSKLKRLDAVVMINANKISFVKGELYSLRRQLACNSSRIHTWGHAWDISTKEKAIKALKELVIAVRNLETISYSALNGWFSSPKKFQGVSQNKLSTLAEYDYAIVVENSLEFMTEKLFDSLFAGTLPIYVGPPLASFGIPNFVAVEAEANLDSVLAAIETASKVDLFAWRKKLVKWLESERVEHEWASEYVLAKIISLIENA